MFNPKSSFLRPHTYSGEYIYTTKAHNFPLILGLNFAYIFPGVGIEWAKNSWPSTYAVDLVVDLVLRSTAPGNISVNDWARNMSVSRRSCTQILGGVGITRQCATRLTGWPRSGSSAQRCGFYWSSLFCDCFVTVLRLIWVYLLMPRRPAGVRLSNKNEESSIEKEDSSLEKWWFWGDQVELGRSRGLSSLSSGSWASLVAICININEFWIESW